MADNRKLRKKQIRKERDKLSDKEIFLSRPYHNSLWRYAKALGKKETISLTINYDEAHDGDIAKTDGRNIILNAANQVTGYFADREEKMLSHEGLVAHECGHVRFTDFRRRNTYLNGFLKGLIYPRPPKVKTAADKRAWKEMKTYLEEKDFPALLCIQETAQYLRNILEDVFVEAGMCQEYPGSVCTAIQKNAAVLIAELPTEKERKEADVDELSIILDLVFRYARAGKTLAEDGYSKSYRRELDKCRSIIDGAVLNPEPDSRLIATNWLMIKLWKYLHKKIENAKKEAEGLSEDEIRKKMNEFRQKNCQLIALSADSDDMEERGEIEGWNGDPDGKPCQDSEVQKSDDMQDLSAFRAGIRDLQKSEKEAATEKSSNANKHDGWNLADKLPEIQNAVAEEKVNKTEERKLKSNLCKEQKNLHLNEIHKDIQIQVHRKLELSEELEELYACMEPEIRKVSRRLQDVIEEVLIRQEGGRLSGLYMGKRLDKSGLYRRDGKLFEKRISPDEGLSIAFAILVDVSTSMNLENRIGYARMASLVLYDFCQKLSIPVMVYGHSTHYPNGYFSGEVVDILAYADFDSVDGKDHLRILEMDTIGSNRDGAALQFVGQRLLKREEEIKILVLISDGSPAAIGYSGDIAKEDLQNIKRDLERQGVKLFAAAIGDDKQQIEDIYQDGFLNISDLKTMPSKLAGLLMNYIR